MKARRGFSKGIINRKEWMESTSPIKIKILTFLLRIVRILYSKEKKHGRKNYATYAN